MFLPCTEEVEYQYQANFRKKLMAKLKVGQPVNIPAYLKQLVGCASVMCITSYFAFGYSFRVTDDRLAFSVSRYPKSSLAFALPFPFTFAFFVCRISLFNKADVLDCQVQILLVA